VAGGWRRSTAQPSLRAEGVFGSIIGANVAPSFLARSTASTFRRIKSVAAEKLDVEFTAEERNNLAELGKRLSLIDAADERFADAFTIFRRGCRIAEHTIAHDRATFRAALKLAKRARIAEDHDREARGGAAACLRPARGRCLL
jgi:hypothetical protein